MASTNVSRVNGATPVLHLSGSPYNGQSNRYWVPASDATALAIGDFVKSGGSADAMGVPSVIKAVAGDTIRGCVVGVIPTTAESPIYRAASVEKYVLVADAPDLIFMMQEDGVGAPTALIDIGENVDLIDAGVNTVTGTSGMQVDSSTHGTSASLALRLMRFAQTVDNVPGVANAKVLVKINKHELASTTGV